MILVSINTTEDICEIDINHQTMQVHLVKKLKMRNDSFLRTAAIFFSVFKGIFILLKRLVFSPIKGSSKN